MTAASATPKSLRGSFHLFGATLVSLGLGLGACGGEDEPKQDPEAKKEEKKLPERPKQDELNPEKKLDLSGPKAPEASTVLFAVDGALVPLACFDKESGDTRGGADCAKLVKEGEEVYVYAEHTKDLDIIGGTKNSLCEVTDNPTSRSAKSVDAGAAYDFAVWPKSAHDLVWSTNAKSRAERTLQFATEEQEALVAAIAKIKSSTSKGEFRPEQKAEFDIDSDGTNEVFYSIIIAHPSDADRNLFAGVLMAPGGDMANLQLIDKAARDTDIVTLSGAVDLDGDGKFDPWTTLTFDGGSGDHIVELVDGKATALSKFSCGV